MGWFYWSCLLAILIERLLWGAKSERDKNAYLGIARNAASQRDHAVENLRVAIDKCDELESHNFHLKGSLKDRQERIEFLEEKCEQVSLIVRGICEKEVAANEQGQ